MHANYRRLNFISHMFVDDVFFFFDKSVFDYSFCLSEFMRWN